jgi:hypothetical protein
MCEYTFTEFYFTRCMVPQVYKNNVAEEIFGNLKKIVKV